MPASDSEANRAPARGAGAGENAAGEGEIAGDKQWAQLTMEQQQHAKVLGYSEESWTAQESPPSCVSCWDKAPDAVMFWEELSEEQKVAAAGLGYAFKSTKDIRSWDMVMCLAEDVRMILTHLNHGHTPPF